MLRSPSTEEFSNCLKLDLDQTFREYVGLLFSVSIFEMLMLLGFN